MLNPTKQKQNGFEIFVDVDGVEYTVDLTPDATVADVIAGLPRNYEADGIIYGGRFLALPELLSDAGVCAETRVTVSHYTFLNDLLPSDFAATDDFDVKVRKMHEIIAIGTRWIFKDIWLTATVVDFPADLFNAVPFMVEEIFEHVPVTFGENFDELIIVFRDPNSPQYITISLFVAGNLNKIDGMICYQHHDETRYDKWVIDPDDAKIMRIG